MSKRGFGELELAILRIFKLGKKMTVKEVHHILGEENKYNTVMTVMSRLFEKNKLARERVGLQYEYWLVSSEAPTLIDQIKKKIFGIKAVEMISCLIESAEEVSDEELADIEKLIEKAKRERKKNE